MSRYVFVILGLCFNFPSPIDSAWTTADLTPKNYNPSRPPQLNESLPLDVMLDLKILSILGISEFEQSFTVDVIYKLSWIDYRLKLPGYHNDLYPIVLDMSWKNFIWFPDVYIRNALKLTTLDGMVAPVTYLEVNPGNNVALIARITAKLICDMQLFAYPHDNQNCYLDSKSLSYNKNQMVLVWENFTVDESIYFPKFRIDNFTSENSCGDVQERRSCIRAILNMSRKVSFYITRFYAPTFLITFATFASYWMPADDIAPRVVINMTPFLTLVTLHNALNNEINVSYVVALHIWMFACMFYTFMGLVVLFFAMQLHASEMRRQAMQERKRTDEENNNLLRKLSMRCVSDPGVDQSQTMDKRIEVHDGRRRSSFVEAPVEWLKQVSQSPTSSSIRIRLKQALDWIRQQSKRLLTHPEKGEKDEEKEYVNAADRVARILAPTTFAAFAIAYVAVFHNYSEENATHSSW